jgi:replication factor A1
LDDFYQHNTYKELVIFFCMGDINYQKMVERIAKASNLDKEEIQRRVEAKCAKLSGLISKEGAAQVIAAELNLSFDDEILKIDELLPGMKRVNFVGKVINLFPVRTFERNGQINKVANIILADDTSNIKTVLWDTNHIDLIENGKVKEGTVVSVGNASVRNNEVHLGSFSEFKVSTEVLNDIKTEKLVKEKSISDFNVGDSVSVRAFIVQNFDPRFFTVCPECKKKAVQESEGFICNEHGKVNPEKRALINIVLDDGSETIRAVLFHDTLSKLGLTDLENSEMLQQQKINLLGKEMVFSGNVRMNNFFNNPEFIVQDLQEVQLDELLKNFES